MEEATFVTRVDPAEKSMRPRLITVVDAARTISQHDVSSYSQYSHFFRSVSLLTTARSSQCTCSPPARQRCALTTLSAPTSRSTQSAKALQSSLWALQPPTKSFLTSQANLEPTTTADSIWQTSSHPWSRTISRRSLKTINGVSSALSQLNYLRTCWIALNLTST